jgi:hypothetical protein
MLLDIQSPPRITGRGDRYRFYTRVLDRIQAKYNQEGARLAANPTDRQFGAWNLYRHAVLHPTMNLVHNKRNVVKASMVASNPGRWRVPDDGPDPFTSFEGAAKGRTDWDGDFSLDALATFDRGLADYVDPLEDFDDYDTTADPNNRFNISTDTINVTALPMNEDAWHADDKGAAFFDGSFEHLGKWNRNSSSHNGSKPFLWGVANSVTNWGVSVDELMGRNEHSIGVRSNSNSSVRMLENNDNSRTTSDITGLSTGTDYWVEYERDITIGSYGTFYCRLFTDESRTVAAGDNSITLTEDLDWRYIFAVGSNNSGSGNVATFDIEALDLQLAAGVVASPYYYQHILGSS